MRLSLVVLLVVSGCQCLQPVDEFPDGGEVDAGRPDGGVADAGAPDAGLATCTRATDCTGTPQVVGWCAQWLGGGDAGFSCVDGQCVASCAMTQGQTCVQDVGPECLRCPPTTPCIPADCGGGFSFTYTVNQVACVGEAPLRVGDRIREAFSDGGCDIPLFLERDGGEVPWGRVYLQSGRGLSARVEALGGTCLATELPTGAPRLLLECPRCQVALGP